MAAGAFYQDTALQHSARATLEPVYLCQTVWVELAASIAHWPDKTVCHK